MEETECLFSFYTLCTVRICIFEENGEEANHTCAVDLMLMFKGGDRQGDSPLLKAPEKWTTEGLGWHFLGVLI